MPEEPAQKEAQTLIKIPVIAKQEPEHDIRLKSSKRKQIRNGLYYSMPVFVIILLFIVHRCISNRYREDVLSVSGVFEKWRMQHGMRSYFVQEGGEEIGPFVYGFTVEKRNVVFSEGNASFDYFRRWSLSHEEMEAISKSETYKTHQNLFPNTSKEENLGHWTVISRTTNFNNIITEANTTFGEFYLPQSQLKPHSVLLPDLNIVLVHDRLTIEADRLVLNGISPAVKSKIIFEKLTPIERITTHTHPLLRWVEHWRYEQ